MVPGKRFYYRITGILGQGGMGSVYRVEHTITRRVEALKVAVRGRPAVAGEDERFLREIQVQASLAHPNIASVHNAFWAGGNHFANEKVGVQHRVNLHDPAVQICHPSGNQRRAGFQGENV
jgi:serine/threonine protein kinase